MANVWTSKTTVLNSDTHNAVAGVIGSDKGYLAGNHSTSNSTEMKEYSQSGNSWAAKTVLPAGRKNPTGYSLGTNETYCVCGDYSGDSQGTNYEYSQSGNSWATKTACPNGRTSFGQGGAHIGSDKGYVVGGTRQPSYWSDGDYGKDVEEYSQSGDSWSTKTSTGVTRAQHYVFNLGSNDLYAVAGRGAFQEHVTNNEVFSQSANTWTTKTALTIAMGSGGSAPSSNKGYVYGGTSGGSSNEVANTYEYDPSGDSWATKANMPGTIDHHTGTPIGTYKTYSFGKGPGGSATNDNYEYTAADPPILELYEDLGTDLQTQWPFQLEDLQTDLRGYGLFLEDLKADLQVRTLTFLEDLNADLAANVWNVEDLNADLQAYADLLTDLQTYLAIQELAFNDLNCYLATRDSTGPYVTISSLSPVPGATNAPTNLNVVFTIKDAGWGVKPSTVWLKIKDETSLDEEQWYASDDGWTGNLSTDKRQYDVALNPLCKPPVAPSVTPQTSGGSMADGSYYYVITAVTPNGETGKGIESAVATISGGGGSGSVDLSWTAVPFAASYKVYRTTTQGSYSDPCLVGSPSTNSFTDTSASPSAGAPPATNTADIKFENVRQLTFTAYAEDEAGNTGLSSQ